MNKFLIFDKELGIHRLPLSYSIGDLDRIRKMFGEHSQDAFIALPQLPPQREAIDDAGTLGYPVFIPSALSSKITEFLEKTVVHVRELKSKGYDYQHPVFKNYLRAREETVSALAEKLESVIDQERRLGVFNLFVLAITKQIVTCLEDILVRSSGSHKLRYMVHPHLKSMLNQVLDQVYEKLAYQDNLTRQDIPFYRGTLKSKLGSNFNFNFVQSILNVQLSLLEPSISPLDPQHQLRKVLVDENSEYYITYNDFRLFYESARDWLKERMSEENSWVVFLLSRSLGIPEDTVQKLRLNSILFDPDIIFTIQENLKQIPVRSLRGLPLRKRTLIDEMGHKMWDQLLLDYVKISSELQRAEVISFFRDRIHLLGPEYLSTSQPGGQFTGLEGKISYNFHEGPVINDHRKVSLMFIDLRGYTEVSSGLIPAQKLKNALYSFFDPTLDIIDHFKGKIRFFAGDAVMATFGEDCPIAERTLNAVRTGIMVQRMLKHMVKTQNLPFEGAGIGINMGLIENAHIFKNFQEKIDTVIGLPANITSRLSSGKSVAAERKGDPAFMRELQDTLQDVLETMKGKVSRRLKDAVVHVFERHLMKYTGDRMDSDVYVPLPEHRRQPGLFKVNIIGGVMDNSGVVLSEEAFQEIKSFHKMNSLPKDEQIEFVMHDPVLGERIIFWQVGDAVLKGIDQPVAVWGVRPEKVD